MARFSRFSGYKGFARINREASARLRQLDEAHHQPAPQIQPMKQNPFIGDNFFKENPSKILGEQTTRSGRWGDVMEVKGTLACLDKIDVPVISLPDVIVNGPALATTAKQDVIQAVMQTEARKALQQKIKPKRTVRAVADEGRTEQDVYTTREIGALYNKAISADELEAYYYSHPELDHTLLFDHFTQDKETLAFKGLLCYTPKGLEYLYTYQSGAIGKKISDLQAGQESFIERHGEEQFNRQLSILTAAKPKNMSLFGENRIILLPHAAFSKEFLIEGLVEGSAEIGGPMSLFRAFKAWIRSMPVTQWRDYELLSKPEEIIKYYLDNKPIEAAGGKSDDKAERDRAEKTKINTQQRVKEEGDFLFGHFLTKALKAEDQMKLEALWNSKYNTIVEPNLTKIPVAFRLAKTWKNHLPLTLNETQRQAAAFMMEKNSALLAYGVGVGKTLASIVCFSQAYFNKLCTHAAFIVPTNTYEKWKIELQGGEVEGVYQEGALPEGSLLPPVVGLHNLNAEIVRFTLKEYTDAEESNLVAIENAIGVAGRLPEAPTTDELAMVGDVWPVEWPKVHNGYGEYLRNTSAKTPSFKKFLVEYLRDELEYYIYAQGVIKPFPKGTIFLLTENGLQRLGVPEQKKHALAGKMFEILMQGEKATPAREREKMWQKIEQTISSSQAKAKVSIDDLGINFACFDESHLYKKLFTACKGEITGEDRNGKAQRDKAKYELKSGAAPSARALSAFVLSHYVQSENKNRGIVHLTATPFTNSPLEVFSMLTLTNYKTLEDLGLSNMVDFFDTFMKINYELKLTPQGKVKKGITLTGYNNVQQLRQVIFSLMDKKDEGANLIRPEKHIWPSVTKNIHTTLPMTVEQEKLITDVKAWINDDTGSFTNADLFGSALQNEKDCFDWDTVEDEDLISRYETATGKDFNGSAKKEGKEDQGLTEAERARLVTGIQKAEEDDVEFTDADLDEKDKASLRILLGMTYMRQITLSPYVYYDAIKRKMNGGAEAERPNYLSYVGSSPKLKYITGCVKSVLDFHKQTGTKPSGQVIYMNAGVRFFGLIKEYLVKEVGLKESEVGLVTGGMSNGAKETIKNKFNSGDIKVLIGSQTISVGVDLQKNSTVLYVAYYDWNPTDAQQVEGRIWRQGNPFANVRIVYPQCFNSSDPITFQYLLEKTQRINDIWNRDANKQELDLKDFDPKVLQKELVTDPEAKADYEINEEQALMQREVLFYENRMQEMTQALSALKTYQDLLPKAKEYLTLLVNRKNENARQAAIARQTESRNRIMREHADDPEKMGRELKKYNDSVKDWESDEAKEQISFEDTNRKKLLSDAMKYMQTVQAWESWDYETRKTWGSDLVQIRGAIFDTLSRFYNAGHAMQRAEKNTLEAMGYTWETIGDPVSTMNAKLTELQEKFAAIEASRPQRIERIKMEQALTAHLKKSVGERIQEFDGWNWQRNAKGEYMLNALQSVTVPVAEPVTIPEDVISGDKAPVSAEAKPAPAPAPAKTPAPPKAKPAKQSPCAMALATLAGYEKNSVVVSLTAQQAAEYDENEEDNFHSENVVFVTKLSGDPVLRKAAAIVLNEHGKSPDGLTTETKALRDRIGDIVKIDRPQTATPEQEMRDRIAALSVLLEIADGKEAKDLKKRIGYLELALEAFAA